MTLCASRAAAAIENERARARVVRPKLILQPRYIMYEITARGREEAALEKTPRADVRYMRALRRPAAVGPFSIVFAL